MSLNSNLSCDYLPKHRTNTQKHTSKLSSEHKQLMDNDKQKQRINYIQTTNTQHYVSPLRSKQSEMKCVQADRQTNRHLH